MILTTLHILGIAGWIGGLIFLLFAVKGPVDRQLETYEKIKVLPEIIRAYLLIIWASVSALFVTGMELGHSSFSIWLDSNHIATTGTVFAIKSGIFLLMAVLSIYLTMGLYPKLNFAALRARELSPATQEYSAQIVLFTKYKSKIYVFSWIILILSFFAIYLGLKLSSPV